MKYAIALTILSIIITVLALLLYKWLMGYVFGMELGWLRWFV